MCVLCASVHSALYIAGGYVYTRNGTGLTNPWVLMPLEDLRVVYYARSEWSVFGYRWRGG